MRSRSIIVCLLTSASSVWLSATPPSAGQPAQPAAPKVEKEFYKPQDRLAAMRVASIFTPRAVSDANMITGPPQEPDQFQLHLNDKVTCAFETPGAEKNGNTPKFDCRITRVESADGHVQELTPQMHEEAVKVKFRPDNRETHSEIASTRLFWSLGFYADGMFPVRVTCTNCPSDPQSGGGTRATREFPEGVIERKFPGHKMYVTGKEDQGWSWKEFESIGAPSYQRDGLKMLAAFVIHSDNKPEQQRLVCDGITVDQTTSPFTTTCRESKMLVQDLGATWGGGGKFTSNSGAKMNLQEWSGKSVWKHAGGEGHEADCQATLPKSLAASDGLGDPHISEEGRRFTAGLLCQLSDQQLSDLFVVTRVSEMPENRNSDGSFKNGLTEAAIVGQWVSTFKQKREAVAAARCQWINKPADLSEIDNPMHLQTVPNFCAARPF